MQTIPPSDEERYLAQEEALNNPIYLLNNAALDINNAQSVQDNLLQSKVLESAQDYITKALQLLEPKDNK